MQRSSVNLTWNFISNDNRVTVIPTTITTDDSIGIIYTTVIKFAYVTEGDAGDYKCTLMTEGEDLKESTFYFEIIRKHESKLKYCNSPCSYQIANFVQGCMHTLKAGR